ncbi:MAG: glutamate synthase-related protein, partial [Pirellulaceae bacterium]
PVGIATQDPILRQKFAGRPEHVINYLFMVAEEARQIMAQLGFRKFTELIGRVDCLETNEAIKHWKAQGVDLTPILTPARKPHDDVEVYNTTRQDHGLAHALDVTLIKKAKRAIEKREKVRIDEKIVITNRTVGTMLSHEIAKRWGQELLPDGTIHIKLTGSAGQSFGAFLAEGVTLELEGDANDYVGKGLSGGRVIIYPPKQATYKPEENILVGNVVLYGATSGQAFFRGRAAERFCVRNSGAYAVIEGCGDHGCEYMTGGRAVILGATGRNFAAGMSGGIAYVFDPQHDFLTRCNLGTVALERVESPDDVADLLEMIELHHKYTGSTVAEGVLHQWPEILGQFVKVMPTDYKRVLAERAKHDEEMEAGVHGVAGA